MTITRNPREAALEAVAEAARQLGDAMDNCQACDAEFRALWRTLKALDALPAADGGWRPIDDEARNGNNYLLWTEDELIVLGYWFGECWCNGDVTDETFGTPTHYMPLPPPPVPQNAEDEG